MPLTDARADHALFVRAARHLLTAGWRVSYGDHFVSPDGKLGLEWREYRDETSTHLHVHRTEGMVRRAYADVTVTSVRQAVGVLAALDLLPAALLKDPDAGPLDGWTECDVPGCPSGFDADPADVDAFDDNDGWAHGVRHHHIIDHWMVRETAVHASRKG